MIELPEALTLASQLSRAVAGKTVSKVLPPTKPHKFCWFAGEVSEYDEKLRGKSFEAAEGFGIFVELGFSDGERLCVNDGVNLRLMDSSKTPKDYQLLILFTDGTALCLTVAMYGGIVLHDGSYDNDYYLKSRAALSPFSPQFPAYYRETLAGAKQSLSAKAFLATDQRFPGLGNGVLQDILFSAGINPRTKLASLGAGDAERLLESIISVLREMADAGGRDTEKDIFGVLGGYKTKMSKNTLTCGCPVCGGEIKKEAYLGGSVYYCPSCQPVIK